MNSEVNYDGAEHDWPPGCHNMDSSVEKMPPEGLGLRARYGTQESKNVCLMWDGRKYITVGAEQTHVFGSERWDVFNIRQDALDAARARGTPLIIDGFDRAQDTLVLPGFEEGRLFSLSYQVMEALGEDRIHYYLDYDSSTGFVMDWDTGRYLVLLLNCGAETQEPTVPPSSEKSAADLMPENHDFFLKVCALARNPEKLNAESVFNSLRDLESSSLAPFVPDTVSDRITKTVANIEHVAESTMPFVDAARSLFSSDGSEDTREGASSVSLVGQPEDLGGDSLTLADFARAGLNIFGSFWGEA